MENPNDNQYNPVVDNETENPTIVDNIAQDQLKIDIDISNRERVGNIHNRLDKFERYVEAFPFWKNGINVFSLVTIISIFLVAEALVINSLKNLPERMPFFYNTVDNTWDLMSRNMLLFIPIVLLIAQLSSFFISFRLYNFDKRLVIVINFCIMVSSLLFLVGLGQMLSMVLV